MNYPLKFFGAGALNIYPLQNDPPGEGRGSTGEGGGGYLGGGQRVMSLPPLVHLTGSD